MKNIQVFFLAILTLFSSNNIKAGTFSFRHYKAEDGLTFNTVRSIIQDRLGFIWVGTENGLNRFDGNTFKEFRSLKNGKNILGSNYIGTLLEDSKGNIWIGTDEGIYIYHPLTEEFTYLSNKVNGASISSTINNIVEDKSGNIWMSTHGQGIYRYNLTSGQLDQYNVIKDGKSSSRYDFINYIYVDRKNRVWAAPKTPRESLIYFEASKNCFRTFKLKQQNGNNAAISIYKIFEDSQQNIWLGTWDKGICKLNEKENSITKYLSPEMLGGILHIHEISEYGPDLLLIGSDDGLSLFNTKTHTQRLFSSSEIDPSAISDKFIYPILKDREGGIWIGTYFGGLNYVSPNSGLFERYTHSRYVNSINGNIIGRFTEDKKGNIWIASDDGGLNCLNTETGHFFAYMPQAGRNSISYHNVHALCWDEDKLWIGTYSGGLNVLDTKTGRFQLYNSVDGNPRTLDGGSIYAIYKDRSNRMWVASMSGINLYNRQTDDFIRFKHFNATTIDITQDHKGLIWFATQGKGVFRFDSRTNQWKNYACVPDSNSSLPSNQTNCILADHKARLWLGTANGLCRYDYAKDRFIPLQLNIPNKTICSIIEDNNMLWLTTGKGLIRYNTLNGSCQIFTRSDGLLSDQFIFNSGFKSSKGKIYIGTANGFNSFCPKNLVANKYIPQVAITNLEIFNKEIEVGPKSPLTQAIGFMKQIDLSYKDNVFSLGYVALSYTTPEKNMYAYKLEGFDKDWNYVNKQNKATYTNLPAGDYVFRVRAANNDGVWNNDGASVKIIIHPPFWLTTGFKIAYALLAIYLFITLMRMMNKRTEQKHKERINQLNQEKEKELYDAKIHFFTTIAHEIRTPVSLIIGPLEKIMESNSALPELIRKDLNIIDRNSQRLLSLVNQLLDFRKAEQGALKINFSRQNIHTLLRNTYDRFSPLVEQKGYKFVFDCPEKDFESDIDQEAVTKIVSNLLTNALKFTESEISLSSHINADQQSFTIQVTDNGVGIADVEKEKVFLPFYQISGLKPGTGIGLSLVKSLVEAHGGNILIKDASPSGVSFIITLPMRNELSETRKSVTTARIPAKEIYNTLITNEKAELSPVNEEEKPLLLIVEDNIEMRDFIKDCFCDSYQVVTAGDGIEGLEKLKSQQVELIISDLMMPRMNGLEFCQALRENVIWSHIPVVLLTAKTDLNSKIEGLNNGADAYVEKPFSTTFLKAQIKNLIESRKALRRRFSELPFVPLNSVANNKADEEFLSKMNAIIDSNISNFDFNVDLLAEQLCISRSGLFVKIKNLVDVTPNELIQLVRLKKAAELLSENKYRINEIGYMVGFNNPSYFTKCFQKQFGIRPGDFMNKHKN
jgi:Signal transduction histidine kinase